MPLQDRRPMTFMDVIELRTASHAEAEPNGRRVLYTLSTPDWKAGKSFTDIHLTSMVEGTSRQMTFTKDKNETAPHWSPDGQWFAFLSDRFGNPQLYLMNPNGGEARKLTDHKDPVSAYSFSRNARYIAYLTGKAEETQIWIIELPDGKPVQLTRHATPVRATGVAAASAGQGPGGGPGLVWSPDSRRIYFVAPDSFDKLESQRSDKKFDVVIKDPVTPPAHLWTIDVESKQETRQTAGQEFTVGNFKLSPDGRHVGFVGQSSHRHENRIDQPGSELYLVQVDSQKPARLTRNALGEGGFAFSPDSRWFAYSASNNDEFYRDRRIYLMPVTGGSLRKFGDTFEGDLNIGFWNESGNRIYFSEGIGANVNVYALDLSTGEVSPITRETGTVAAAKEAESKTVLVTFSGPHTPTSIYATTVEELPHRAAWRRVVNPNPQVAEMALGEYQTIRWKSTDGVIVEGILVKPVGYVKGQRYPLVVQLHGGPAAASQNSFSGNYGTYVHVFAGNGYAVLQPNYRGSTNYGEKFKRQISTNYFTQAYDDIMTGVDFVIKEGIADPDKLGCMGWSAGGHWSNYILTQTHRFKAISSGAGVFNWVSMYGQTDMQENREWYIGGKVGAYPWDNLQEWLRQSPVSYIKNAKTPTLIHVGADDSRVPRPQSEELYMALKKLGVPTEFIVYPKMPHGLTEMRYQMVKMVAEFNWFEKWIKGKEGWIDWKPLLDSVGEDKPPATTPTDR
ncbi:MAG: S9 family peptidase [Acidobacteria bacterium]|nr:S9 family peptidase [Acidobacteriota bacterium]